MPSTDPKKVAAALQAKAYRKSLSPERVAENRQKAKIRAQHYRDTRTEEQHQKDLEHARVMHRIQRANFTDEQRKVEREYALKRSKKRRKEVRKIIDAAKDIPCVDCGKEYPSYVMHFDHVRGEKKFPVSQFIQRPTYSYDHLYAEIAKCEVRCANCHLLRHHGNPSKGMHI